MWRADTLLPLLGAGHVLLGVALVALLLRVRWLCHRRGLAPAQVSRYLGQRVSEYGFVAVLALAAGSGLLAAELWGWWLAAVFHAHGVFRHSRDWLAALASRIVRPHDATVRALVPLALARQALRLVLHVLLVLTLVQPEVTALVGLNLPLRTVIPVLVIAGVVFGVLTSRHVPVTTPTLPPVSKGSA